MPIRLVIDGTQTVPPHIRGAKRYVVRLIEALVNAGENIDLKIFCNTIPNKRKSSISVDAQISPTSFSWLPGRCLEKWWDLFSHPLVDRFVGPHDVFHAPTIHIVPPTGGKLVCTVHDLVPLVFPDQYSQEYVHFFTNKLAIIKRRADLVIADSESTKNDLVNLMNFRSEQIYVKKTLSSA